MITHNDMLRALRGEPKAEEAIFWFAYTWHSGKGSDLYRVLGESPYRPDHTYNFSKDPELPRLFGILEQHFLPTIQAAYGPVHINELEDGDILIAGSHFTCITNRWPCRVFKLDGKWAVTCQAKHADSKLPAVHWLTTDDRGFVQGFRR